MYSTVLSALAQTSPQANTEALTSISCVNSLENCI